MKQKYIRYLVPVDQITLKNKHEVKVNSCNISSIEIEQYKKIVGVDQKETCFNKIAITFITKKDKFNDIDDSEIRQNIYDILNKMAFTFLGASIGDAYYDSSNLEGSERNDSLRISFRVTSSNLEKDFQKALDSNEKYEDPLYNTFRLAMQNTDIISRFMFLYQILLDTCENHWQKQVDKVINDMYENNKDNLLKGNPEYKVWQLYRKDRNRNPIEETKFTFLRNQVGHSIEGSNPKTIREDMSCCINDLEIIVKEKVKEEIEKHKENP